MRDAHVRVGSARIHAAPAHPDGAHACDRGFYDPVRGKQDQPVAARLAYCRVAHEVGAEHHPIGIEQLGELLVGQPIGQIGHEHVASDLVRPHRVILLAGERRETQATATLRECGRASRRPASHGGTRLPRPRDAAEEHQVGGDQFGHAMAS